MATQQLAAINANPKTIRIGTPDGWAPQLTYVDADPTTFKQITADSFGCTIPHETKLGRPYVNIVYLPFPPTVSYLDAIDARSQAIRMWNTERDAAQKDLDNHMRALGNINNYGYEASLVTHEKRTRMLRRNLTRAILNCEIADAQYHIEHCHICIENAKKDIVAHQKQIVAHRKKLAQLP